MIENNKEIKSSKFFRYVNILGKQYKICLFDYDCHYLGLTDTKEKTILIARNIDKEKFDSVFIHELTHAYLFECGLDNYCQDEILVNWLNRFIPKIYKLSEEIILNIKDLEQ